MSYDQETIIDAKEAVFRVEMEKEELVKALNDANSEMQKLKEDLARMMFETVDRDSRSLGSILENRNSFDPGHRHFPIIVPLVDGATVALKASEGDIFTLSAAGNRTILAPTGAIQDGQKLIIRHLASAADRTLALTTGSAGAFRFGTTITALTATTSGKYDYIGAIYNSTSDRWDVIGYVKNY